MTEDPRRVALGLLAAVLDGGQPLDEALETQPGFAHLSRRDRAFVHGLVALTLRRLGQIDLVIAGFLDHPLPHRRKLLPVRNILRLGTAQSLFRETPAHAVVSTALKLAGGRRNTAPYKGLINAVLRRITERGAAVRDAQDAPRLNTPDWLWRAWTAAYGEATAHAIAGAHLQEPPPLDLTPRADPHAWAGVLDAEVLPTGTLRRPGGGNVADLPGYAEGAWWVQDAGATLPARLLGDVAGRRVLDLAAAPGGKTAQLAAAGARVTAVDRGDSRNARVRQNLDRLGLEAEVVTADATEWRPDAPADAVLLDAPCTATGTLRRNPDVAHLKTPDAVRAATDLQDALLEAAAAMTAPGGTLVYCVCSLQPEEAEQRVAAFLERHPGAARRPVTADEAAGRADWLTPDGDLRTLPCHLAERGGMDAFYAARLVMPGA